MPSAPAGQALAWPSGSRAPMWSPSWSSRNHPLQARGSEGCLEWSVPMVCLSITPAHPVLARGRRLGCCLGRGGSWASLHRPWSALPGADTEPERWDLLRKAAQGVSSLVFWGVGWRENFQDWL